MVKFLEFRNGVTLQETTLTDGSKVYDVLVKGVRDPDPVIEFHVGSDVEGYELFRKISALSFTVHERF